MPGRTAAFRAADKLAFRARTQRYVERVLSGFDSCPQCWPRTSRLTTPGAGRSWTRWGGPRRFRPRCVLRDAVVCHWQVRLATVKTARLRGGIDWPLRTPLG